MSFGGPGGREIQCLVLGPSNSGKTQLLKAVQGIFQGKETRQSALDESPALLPPTQPTTGTNLVSLDTPRGTVLLREYGGKMAPLWHKTIPKADILIYLIDSSNPLQLSSSVVLLMETLSNKSIEGKPVLLFFNKTDSTSSLSLEELKFITRVKDLKVKYGTLLTVLSGSCLNSDGINGLAEWLTNNSSAIIL